MLPRTTTLLPLAVAAVIAAGGTSAGTVVFQAAGHQTGTSTSVAHRQDATHRSAGTSTSTASTASAPELPPCPADVKNHGEYVSSVARDNHGHAGEHGAPADTGTNHGALVSAAAHSDCGKPVGASTDATASGTAGSGADAGATSHGKSGKSHGKSGKSHGKSGEHSPSQAPAGS